MSGEIASMLNISIRSPAIIDYVTGRFLILLFSLFRTLTIRMKMIGQ